MLEKWTDGRTGLLAGAKMDKRMTDRLYSLSVSHIKKTAGCMSTFLD